MFPWLWRWFLLRCFFGCWCWCWCIILFIESQLCSKSSCTCHPSFNLSYWLCCPLQVAFEWIDVFLEFAVWIVGGLYCNPFLRARIAHGFCGGSGHVLFFCCSFWWIDVTDASMEWWNGVVIVLNNNFDGMNKMWVWMIFCVCDIWFSFWYNVDLFNKT